MSSDDPLQSVELIIVPPRSAPEAANEFAGRCVISGVHFFFEDGDRLPSRVPEGLKRIRAIVIEDDEVPDNAQVIEAYEKSGVCLYRMRRENLATVPNATLSWNGELTFQTICFDSGLTMDHPQFRASRIERQDDALLNDLGEQILRSENVNWYDATRYQWESMLDAYEVTGEHRYFDAVQRQIRHAMENCPNRLANCDTVAPFLPMLRLYQLTNDARLLEYSKSKFDEYLKATPLCEGVLVNFPVYRHNVRTEILWQVLPALLMLARVTSEKKYLDFALDQYERSHRLLFDADQSLWSHGYANGRRTAGFWARGVAFAFLGHLIVLESMPRDDRRFEHCLQTFIANANRLHELQDASGFWTCVPTQPGSGKESSGTAWICAGIERAIRLGFLDQSYRACADLAWDAVKSRIWQGRYPGHMTATTVSLQPEYYLKKGISETGWAHFAMRPLCERKRTQAGIRK